MFSNRSGSPSKSSGQYHEKKGSLKKTIGKMFGLGGTADRGRMEHAEGKGEYNAARAQGYVEGTADRVTGKKDSVVGAVTGDHSQQHAGETRGNKGDMKQSINRHL
ncbi:hypothetical protein BD626DRAFT_5043 [Schizophyllum amplum]|uniref:CsbD-like domain-containing protein n=1 Tax=Schizophyllum amplum TaxID=97359 RepID=A0A550CWB6_9AGAR|nr:hypothetical protein BD626DRAFT_5043 [Auriculariopsis ampla]